MTKHVKALTYKPKIEPVLDGRCCQTIRKGDKIKIGDEILFHGWSGRPYRSKWDWRKRVIITKVADIKISKYGIDSIGKCTGTKYKMLWDDVRLNELAAADFIDPPTGEGLRDVLFRLNKPPENPEDYQVIVWSDTPTL